MLYTETHGSGPELFLVHGWGMHGGVWDDTVELLANEHRCTTVDLPGHGRSRHTPAWSDFDQLVDQVMEVTPAGACWVGWSLGGLVALGAALRHPRAVTRLVLVGSSPCFQQQDDWHCAMAPGVLEQFAESLDSDCSGALNRFLALEVHGIDHAAEHLRRLREIVFEHGAPEPEALRAGLAMLRSVDLRPWLRGLRCPLRILAGRRDNLVPPIAAAATVRLAGDGRSRVLENGGHAPFLTDPDGFVEALRSFLYD